MKRIKETIRAFVGLGLPDWKLEIAGPASPQITASHLADVSGAAWGRTVLYRGSLTKDELVDLYRRSAGLVLFSRRENFANVVAEAAVNGCPSFVSDRVGLAPVIRERSWGAAYSIVHQADIATALRGAIEWYNCESVRRRIQAESRAVFSFDAFAGAVKEIVGTSK